MMEVTYDITATVTVTDASSNTATQEITVSIRDVGGIDDNTETGTGTNTSTNTGTGTGTDTATKQELILEQNRNCYWNRNWYWNWYWYWNEHRNRYVIFANNEPWKKDIIKNISSRFTIFLRKL